VDESMLKPYLLSIIGDDQPGLVDAIAEQIAVHGGNWQTSQLAHLAGKFAGIVLISIPTAEAGALEESLKRLSDRGLSVRVTEAGTEPSYAGVTASLSIIGPDRPGIVREVSQSLAQRAINVLSFESDIVPAPMTNEPLFHAALQVALPSTVDEQELEARLTTIADEMTIDIDFEID
jgi:glycine cleavage system regulatory protein